MPEPGLQGRPPALRRESGDQRGVRARTPLPLCGAAEGDWPSCLRQWPGVSLDVGMKLGSQAPGCVPAQHRPERVCGKPLTSERLLPEPSQHAALGPPQTLPSTPNPWMLA